jgi:branched-chain amino acid transport system ATP-binding protein
VAEATGKAEAMSRALQVITQQQRAMSSALLAVRTIARKALRSGGSPDFSQLAPLLNYLERFPETLHQANEEKHLFRVLEAREPRLVRLVARLRRDHAAMKGYGQRLRTAVAYWRTGDPKAGRQTALMADDYVRFCRQHARLEQRELLPAALELLSDAEWSKIDQALASIVDPLANSKCRRDCEIALKQFAGGA